MRVRPDRFLGAHLRHRCPDEIEILLFLQVRKHVDALEDHPDPALAKTDPRVEIFGLRHQSVGDQPAAPLECGPVLGSVECRGIALRVEEGSPELAKERVGAGLEIREDVSPLVWIAVGRRLAHPADGVDKRCTVGGRPVGIHTRRAEQRPVDVHAHHVDIERESNLAVVDTGRSEDVRIDVLNGEIGEHRVERGGESGAGEAHQRPCM